MLEVPATWEGPETRPLRANGYADVYITIDNGDQIHPVMHEPIPGIKASEAIETLNTAAHMLDMVHRRKRK